MSQLLETQIPENRAAKLRTKPLRVAVIGCGAVSQMFHLPILAGHPNFSLSALVDPNLDVVRALASAYSVPTVASVLSKLPTDGIDAALVATPACWHAELSIELLNRGIHALVEKPMATSGDDAEAMVRFEIEPATA